MKTLMKFWYPCVACLLAAVCLAGCAAPSSPEGRLWSAYLRSSPFSYDTESDPKIVQMLADEIRALPLNGADAEVAAHIRAVGEWAALYPVYSRRAVEVREAHYDRNKLYEQPVVETSKAFGAAISRSGYRLMGGSLGAVFGWVANEMYSRHQANKAAAEVMRPLVERGLRLARAEHSINVRLNFPTTSHLRRILGIHLAS